MGLILHNFKPDFVTEHLARFCNFVVKQIEDNLVYYCHSGDHSLVSCWMSYLTAAYKVCTYINKTRMIFLVDKQASMNKGNNFKSKFNILEFDSTISIFHCSNIFRQIVFVHQIIKRSFTPISIRTMVGVAGGGLYLKYF